MRITRVYTRVGDRGTTRLVGGHEVDKDATRIEAYGTVDELNAVIGLGRAFNRPAEGVSAEAIAAVDTVLAEVQNDLFNVGAELSTRPADRWPGMYLIGESDVTRMERWIDRFNDELPPLKEFILPGGGPLSAFLHQARTVCRRAERRLVTLIHEEPDVGLGCMQFLNRLSDLLFVLARWAARARGEPETLWQKPTR